MRGIPAGKTGSSERWKVAVPNTTTQRISLDLDFIDLLAAASNPRWVGIIADDHHHRRTSIGIGMPAPSSSSSNTSAASAGTTKPRPASSRHSAAATGPLAPTPPTTAGTLKASSPTSPVPPTSPTASSKLPRFLQSPANRDRSKSLSVDRPPSAASSSASHATSTSNTSNSTSTSSASGRRSATRFLGLGKDKDKDARERERQRIREAERGAPSAAELLTLHESGQQPTDSPTSYDFAMSSSPPSAYATARPRTRSERHFSASTPPSSTSGSSNGHGGDLTLARTPSRLGAETGALATRLSGWFAHLAGSTSDLSIAATIGGSLSQAGSTAAALASSASRKPDAKSSNLNSKSTSSKADTKSAGGGSKTSLLDKAVRYLLDGDANPDRSSEEIWLMGVRLPGWGVEDEERVAAAAADKSSSSHSHSHHGHHHGNPLSPRRRSTSKSRSPASPHPPHTPSHPPSSSHADADGAYDEENDTSPPDAGPWPALFHAAFYAQVWCTYRAGFEPIRDLPSLSSLPPPLAFPGPHPSSPSYNSSGTLAESASTVVPTSPKMQHSPSQSDSSAYSSGSSRGGRHSTTHSQAGSHASSASSSSYASYNNSYASSNTSTSKKKWWPLGNSGTKGWSSDAGWGCMLRTSQSLLASALGRVGEPPLIPALAPPFPPRTRHAHALHARLLSWFLDAPAAPFGVHRMALAGKAAGKDVGMWFGPSAAAGALRMLVEAFPACGLGVSVATDGTLYQTEVFAASHSPAFAPSSSSAASVSSSHGHSSSSHGSGSKKGKESKKWGDRPVLLLLGIRLGLDGVNPIYYETIKLLYTFPQSVGIAGGRPSSSYYFVGVQGDGLFYLDPHHSRPAVPLRWLAAEPAPSIPRPPASPSHGHHSYTSTHSHERRSLSPEAAYARGGSTSPESGHGHGFARGGSLSPELVLPVDLQPAGAMSPTEETYFAQAYSTAEMRTFHCERVRKMPLSGLDPSMLLGFVVRDEAEWVDLRRRVKELPRTIFAIADEPPTWPGADDDDMGLESISDPEEEEEEEVGMDDGDVSSTSHVPSSNASHGVSTSSTFSHTHQHHNSNSTSHSASTSSSSARSEEVDTEEDSVAPITPLPGSRFDLSGAPPPPSKDNGKGTVGDAYAELEGDDGFVDAGGGGRDRGRLDRPRHTARACACREEGIEGEGEEQEQEGGARAQRALPLPCVGGGWEWGGDTRLAEGAGAGEGEGERADGYGVAAGGGGERWRECGWAADAHRAGAGRRADAERGRAGHPY
ncbi:hypothetical protein MVEN_00134800 [Mycena venus]|uniref:Autophagy-related protein 4 n=1 Tax=Mycena venus TaxID=2733690 RepID=A0A8H7DDJ3_9AGAR|nr:hypothetical protein MVEN_00134800 [Mycena venus]